MRSILLLAAAFLLGAPVAHADSLVPVYTGNAPTGTCSGPRVIVESTTGHHWCCITGAWTACDVGGGGGGGSPAGVVGNLQTKASSTTFGAYAGTGSAPASQWLRSLDASGAATWAQPGWTDISGKPSTFPATVPVSSATTSAQLGGIDSSRFFWGDNASNTVNAYIPEGGVGANGITKSGFYRHNGSDVAGGLLLDIEHSGQNGYRSQLIFDYGTGAGTDPHMYIRSRDGANWSNIREFIHQGNIGSQTAGFANQLAATGTSCSAGNAARGIDTSGNATGCFAVPTTPVSVGNGGTGAATFAQGLIAGGPTTTAFTAVVGTGSAGGYFPEVFSGYAPHVTPLQRFYFFPASADFTTTSTTGVSALSIVYTNSTFSATTVTSFSCVIAVKSSVTTAGPQFAIGTSGGTVTDITFRMEYMPTTTTTAYAIGTAANSYIGPTAGLTSFTIVKLDGRMKMTAAPTNIYIGARASSAATITIQTGSYCESATVF